MPITNDKLITLYLAYFGRPPDYDAAGLYTPGKTAATSVLDKLGYEQMRALAILNKTPDTEASALCAQADCSFDELFQLAGLGLLDLGKERIAPKALHPTITGFGKDALCAAVAILPALGE